MFMTFRNGQLHRKCVIYKHKERSVKAGSFPDVDISGDQSVSPYAPQVMV